MYWIYFQDFLACMHLIQLVKGLVIIWQVQSGVQGKKEKKKAPMECVSASRSWS